MKVELMKCRIPKQIVDQGFGLSLPRMLRLGRYDLLTWADPRWTVRFPSAPHSWDVFGTDRELTG